MEKRNWPFLQTQKTVFMRDSRLRDKFSRKIHAKKTLNSQSNMRKWSRSKTNSNHSKIPITPTFRMDFRMICRKTRSRWKSLCNHLKVLLRCLMNRRKSKKRRKNIKGIVSSGLSGVPRRRSLRDSRRGRIFPVRFLPSRMLQKNL
jgi:hypothetical protein